MIEDVERYKNITQKIQYHNEKIIEAFNLFIKLFSLVVAGAVWLSTQQDPLSRHPLYGTLAYVVMLMLTVMTAVTVIVNLSAWYGYRLAETGLVGKDKVPPPSIPHSCWTEIVMLLCVITASGMFCYFNPLGR